MSLAHHGVLFLDDIPWYGATPRASPPLANPGNLHSAHDRPAAARRCYERAVQRDPAGAKAWFNLANVLHDLRQDEAARLLYRDAVALYPPLAHAHADLALPSEKLDLGEEAQTRRRQYRALKPAGDWARVAREHLRRPGEGTPRARGR